MNTTWIDYHIQKIEQEEQEYINSKSEDFKQTYWNKYVFTTWWYHDRWTTLPIDIKILKQRYSRMESNFNRFIPWIMRTLEEEWFTWTIDSIFTLDESAEHYLRVHSLTVANSQAVEWIVSQTEQQYIELAEKVGDLFYDALADVLEWISETASSEISSNLKKASEHIQNAWRICEPYINKKTNPKHKANVAWMDNKILGNRIGKLDSKTLKKFLTFLWEKIYNDWLADEWRWRKKLATELFECSSQIKQISILL
jgi:hypothetical protein